jgi:hypothetical protein
VKVKGEMSDLDFASKVEWEGGIIAALEYGLSEDHLEDGEESPLFAPWLDLRLKYEELAPLLDAVQDALDSVEEEDED